MTGVASITDFQAQAQRARRSATASVIALTVVIIVGGLGIAWLASSEDSINQLVLVNERQASTVDGLASDVNGLVASGTERDLPSSVLRITRNDLRESVRQLRLDEEALQRHVDLIENPRLPRAPFVSLPDLREFRRNRIGEDVLAAADLLAAEGESDEASRQVAILRLSASLDTGELLAPVTNRQQIAQRMSSNAQAQVRNLLIGLGAAIAAALLLIWAFALFPALRSLNRSVTLLSRHAADQAILNRRLAAAQRVARSGYWSRSDDDLEISEELAAILGLEPDRPLDLTDLAALSPDDDFDATSELYLSLSNNEGTAEITRTVERPDGRMAVVREMVDSRPVDGRLQMFGVLMDITELIEAQQLATRMEKLELVDLLTKGVVHDFNNLIGVILANVELALERADGRLSRLEAIRATCGSARALVEQLRLSSAGQVGSANVVDASNEVHRIVETFTHRNPGITVRANAAESRCWIRVNQGLFENAIVNLVQNAIEALGSQGRVEVVVEPRGGPGTGSPSQIVIEVIDNGMGMTEAVRRRAIDPFFTTKGKRAEGRGMGLWSVYAFVDQSDGELEIESARGKGTTARMVFPATPPPQRSQPAIGPRPTATVPAEHAEVLLVEDNDAYRELLIEALTRWGMAVHAADSFEGGKTLLSALDRIDIALIDVDLGDGGSGLDLAQLILDQDDRYIEVLVISGGRLGADGDPMADPRCRVLRKPFALDELEMALRSLSRVAPN